jgi:hypothetical protein
MRPSETVPAIDRYDGIMARILKKYIREGLLDPKDILFVSPVLGLVRALDLVPYHERLKGSWQNLELDRHALEEMNRAALELVKEQMKSQDYSEAYINVGKALYPIIEGIEKLISCEVVHSKGRGPGPKAAHMRDWILSKKAT